MTRLPSALLRRAFSLDPLLPLLLRECRDLESAQNELRWLREHVYSKHNPNAGENAWLRERQLRSMVRQRARGRPLQYILGDQPFGDLEILCQKGVLIPRYGGELQIAQHLGPQIGLQLSRPETESYTFRVAQLILSQWHSHTARDTSPLRILDLCTGTGCIPLLLHSLLAPSIPNLTLVGIDISPRALSLAKRNLEHNISHKHLSSRARQDVHFLQADVLRTSSIAPALSSVLAEFTRRSCPRNHDAAESNSHWDVLISNPPYISPIAFGNGITKRSVRVYEPKLALVPPPLPASSSPSTHLGRDSSALAMREAREKMVIAQQDSFYPRLVDISRQIGARWTVLECGDAAQAGRILRLVNRENEKRLSEEGRGILRAEIWKCDSFGCDDTEEADSESEGDDEGAKAVAIYRSIEE